MVFRPTSSPDKDTGWGLIFRLNDLLKEIETLSFNGEYDKWNYKLDRIWTNLCYKNDLDIKRDDEGKLKEIKLSKEDYEEKEFLDNQILKAKSLMKVARKNKPENYLKSKEYVDAKKQLYQSLLIKDIWMRKRMKEDNLYIKEIKHNPAGAMWNQ